MSRDRDPNPLQLQLYMSRDRGTQLSECPRLSCRSILIQAGRVCTVRESRGDDEMAACGQLGVDQERLAPTLRVPQQFEAALSLP